MKRKIQGKVNNTIKNVLLRITRASENILLQIYKIIK